MRDLSIVVAFSRDHSIIVVPSLQSDNVVNKFTSKNLQVGKKGIRAQVPHAFSVL